MTEPRTEAGSWLLHLIKQTYPIKLQKQPFLQAAGWPCSSKGLSVVRLHSSKIDLGCLKLNTTQKHLPMSFLDHHLINTWTHGSQLWAAAADIPHHILLRWGKPTSPSNSWREITLYPGWLVLPNVGLLPTKGQLGAEQHCW